MQYQLREYQQDAVDKGVELLKGSKKNGVIVLPTGAGKSLVISNIADAMDGHTLVLQPSKEILEQNYQKLLALGRTDVSIFSASLGIKRIDKITLATIGSIHKKPELFSEFEQILVDECDLVNSKEGMYKSFFETINKPVLGFTASPWRMQPGHKKTIRRGNKYISTYTGSINRILTRTKPRIFEDIIHITQIHELYDLGFLCPLDYVEGVFDQSQLTLNSTGNDYTDASVKRISSNVTRDAVWAVRRSKAKHHLIFTKTTEDARTISEGLNAIDIKCAVLTAESKKDERENIIEDFKAGRLDAVVNVGVLTVGFDFPELDHIVVARALNSTRLWYQIVGRGIRIHPSKIVCILTDLCGNVARLGKIEDWIIKDENGDKKYRLFNKDKPLTGIDLKSGEDLEKPSNKSQNQNKIHFGKHKGKLISEVPAEYLDWIIDNFSDGDFKETVINELKKRGMAHV